MYKNIIERMKFDLLPKSMSPEQAIENIEDGKSIRFTNVYGKVLILDKDFVPNEWSSFVTSEDIYFIELLQVKEYGFVD